MIAFLTENMAPIMFRRPEVLFLLFGYSVRSRSPPAGCSSASSASSSASSTPAFLQALPLRIFGIMQNDTLLAIPFFTFMGLILERSGMAEDLLDTIGQLFGPIRGGLAYAVILVGAHARGDHRRRRGVGDLDGPDLAADHAALRLRPPAGLGVIAASGTLAQIIPPSLVLIVLADQLGRSVGDLYQGRVRSRIRADRAVRRLCPGGRLIRPANARRCRRGAHDARGRRLVEACVSARRCSPAVSARPRWPSRRPARHHAHRRADRGVVWSASAVAFVALR